MPKLVQHALDVKPAAQCFLPLRKVRSVNLSYVFAASNRDLSTLAPFFALPSLQFLGIERHRCNGRFGLKDGMASKLKHLELRQVEIDGAGLAKILRACPSLRYLELTLSFQLLQAGLTTYADLGDAVRAHGSLLETLVVSQKDLFKALSDIVPPFGDLHALSALRSLHIDVDMLWGWAPEGTDMRVAPLQTLLPRSVASLSLGRPQFSSAANFDAYLGVAMVDERFASVQTVRMSGSRQFLECSTVESIPVEGWELTGMSEPHAAQWVECRRR